MKFVPLLLLTFGSVLLRPGTVAFAAASDADQSGELVALEKKLAAARDEVAALKTALAISKSETAAAETRAKTLAGSDSQLDTLRSQVRMLERDLQSATTALKRVAADKAAAESALAAANEQLAGTPRNATASRPSADVATARAAPAVDARVADLQAQLNEARSHLTAAEKELESRDAALTRLRASLAAAEAQPTLPATVTQELAELRNQVAVVRDLQTRVRQLELENETLIGRLANADGAKDELRRVATARAEAEQKLATLSDALREMAKERDEARAQAARVGVLESRLRQLESANASVATGGNEGTVTKEEFARVAAAQASAESKLATVLRSFTLLTKERDELRARLADLEAKIATSSGKTPEE